MPQKGDEKPLEYKGLNISFRRQFSRVTEYYRDKGGFSVFYRDYRSGAVPQEIRRDLRLLARLILYTITRYPMKHLGYSMSRQHYSIFSYERGSRIDESKISPGHLIERCGRFSLDRDLFEVFREFGGYIAGDNAVISKWAEFSVRANREIGVDYEKVLEVLSEYPITERDTGEASKFYLNLMMDRGYLECVWSGRKIRDPITLHIDHVIPFSAWRNNDLWNLMPSHVDENMRKRDRIPSQALLQRRKTTLQSYWKALMEKYPEEFISEVKLSLTGRSYDDSMLIEEAYKKLLEKTRFLVENRSYREWDL
jgi:hypothetical protein